MTLGLLVEEQVDPRVAELRFCLLGALDGPDQAAIDLDGVHAHVGLFGAEDVAELIERGLRRSVSAPTVVCLDACVRRDVHDRAE